MQLSASLQPLATDAAAAPQGPVMRCVMANFRWESAVSPERADEYNNDIGAVATHKDWQAEHQGYLSASVHIAKDLPRCAESFSASNGLAHLNENLDNTYLLRLEALDGLFNEDKERRQRGQHRTPPVNRIKAEHPRLYMCSTAQVQTI